MSHIPRAWASILTRLHEAQVERSIMRGRDTPPQARDDATDRYVTAVDALVAELGLLKDAGTLAQITLFLETGAIGPDMPGA